MEQSELLCRLISDNIEALENDRDYKKTESIIRTLGSRGKADCRYRECVIDSEWITVIEELLPYAEKAIEEGRHFIKKEGETVRIDQVKKVSADSTQHLARHSNYLTKTAADGETLIPEKLYVTESTDNYMLYENRFLYTLLVYLKDFVQTKYNEIVSDISSVFCDISFGADVNAGNETYSIKLSLTEQRDNIAFNEENVSCGHELRRISDIIENVSVLLDSSLMRSAAPLSLLTLPITATNIIKNDINFQYSYRLFDFVMNYSKKGFEIKEKHNTVTPLRRESCDSITVVLALLSYTARAEGMSLYDVIKENAERQELSVKTGIPEIDDLKAKLLIEKDRNMSLSRSLETYRILNETAEEYKKKIAALESELESLRGDLTAKNAEITALRIQTGQFGENDHTEEESFRALALEKEAFDKYYDSKFPQIKKTLRKKYIWDKFKE